MHVINIGMVILGLADILEIQGRIIVEKYIIRMLDLMSIKNWEGYPMVFMKLRRRLFIAMELQNKEVAVSAMPFSMLQVAAMKCRWLYLLYIVRQEQQGNRRVHQVLPHLHSKRTAALSQITNLVQPRHLLQAFIRQGLLR